MPSDVLQTLSDLVRIDSVNPEWGGPGEAGVADYVRRFLEEAGLEVWVREVLPGRSNVHARLPGRDRSRCLLLEAHMDTVTTSGMEIAPFEPEIRDRRLYGRGSCDVKAGLAVMMHAVKESVESGESPPCDVILAAVVDEEHAYRGVLGLIDDLRERGISPAAAIVAEPTELRVVRANKGVLRFRIVAEGKAAHSSRPHLGVSAIEGMARVILALRKDSRRLEENQHPLLGPATCSVGTIQGGTQVNFVPDRCVVQVDRRLLPGERTEEVLSHYDRLLEPIRSEESGLRLLIEPPYLADEAMETGADEEVVQACSEALASLGLDPEPIGVPFGCDCTKLSRAGIPSIIFGPGSIDRAHTAGEFVETDQVVMALRVLRALISRD